MESSVIVAPLKLFVVMQRNRITAIDSPICRYADLGHFDAYVVLRRHTIHEDRQYLAHDASRDIVSGLQTSCPTRGHDADSRRLQINGLRMARPL